MIFFSLIPMKTFPACCCLELHKLGYVTDTRLHSPPLWRSCVGRPADRHTVKLSYSAAALKHGIESVATDLGSVTVTDRVQLSYHHAGGYLSGVGGVSDVLEALGGVSSRLLPEHLLSSGVLTRKTNFNFIFRRQSRFTLLSTEAFRFQIDLKSRYLHQLFLPAHHVVGCGVNGKIFKLVILISKCAQESK